MVRLLHPRSIAYILLATAIFLPVSLMIRALERVRVVGEGKGLVGVVFFLSVFSAIALAVANWQIAVAYRTATPARSVWLKLERAMFICALAVAAFPALALLSLASLRRAS